ncbi:MAG: hypothetical protein LC745_07915 [Planctomycetia bacterium]|nr:hypothetical protein [Planctomycetia bacterium]
MDTPHNRRDFVRALALGAPAALTVPGAVEADEPEKDRPKTEADARMELVLARYGKRLDDDARKKVRAEVEAIVRRAEALRKFPLDNGDGPLPVFHPFRAPLA